MVQNVDTLEVDRLLQCLEDAISSGNVQQAADFAQNLAKKKFNIQCSMKEVRKDLQNVGTVIKSRSTHMKPNSLQLASTTTVAQLKEKIFEDFQIPAKIQRWKIKRDFMDNDDVTLKELKAFEGSKLILSIAVPKFWIAHEVNDEDSDLEIENEEIESEMDESESQSEYDEIDGENSQNENSGEGQQENTVPMEEKMEDETTIVGSSQTERVLMEQEIAVEKDETASRSFQLKELNDLIQMECYEILPNIEAIECPICLSVFEPAEGVILHECRHGFCWDCISTTIKHCENAEVKCPYVDDDYTCMSFLQEREIKALVDGKVYEKHLAKSLSLAENKAGSDAFHCKTPDCTGWCFNDEDVTIFHCPVCDQLNCLTCRVIHNGTSCWEYQENIRLQNDPEAKKSAEALEEMLKKGEAMTCPFCGAIVMKVSGCDALQCIVCLSALCWATKGARWGPRGPGDTSGGCGCSTNGRRCHPQCRNCH